MTAKPLRGYKGLLAAAGARRSFCWRCCRTFGGSHQPVGNRRLVQIDPPTHWTWPITRCAHRRYGDAQHPQFHRYAAAAMVLAVIVLCAAII